MVLDEEREVDVRPPISTAPASLLTRERESLNCSSLSMTSKSFLVRNSTNICRTKRKSMPLRDTATYVSIYSGTAVIGMTLHSEHTHSVVRDVRRVRYVELLCRGMYKPRSVNRERRNEL